MQRPLRTQFKQCRVFFAAIAGPTEPVDVGRDGNNPVLKASCQSANGIAVPAIRIRAVVESLNPGVTPKPFYSICEASVPMKSIAAQLRAAAVFRACP